jgi:2-keto-3-deoxy-6-phosphogluconate aldolase
MTLDTSGANPVTPATFVEQLGQAKASAILRTNDQEKAAKAMDAAIRGGFRIIEFTLTTPGVYELVQDFSRRDDLVVGTGTVMDVAQAQRSVEAGARFLVSPVVDEAVIGAANDLGGGPDWVRSVLAPMPYLKIVPTNGVDQHNAGEWIAAGAFAVGFVAPLFAPADIAAGRWDAIEERARQCLAAICAVRADAPADKDG